jgi:lipoprotein-anchoring transpeptidase ErfK/SrfK
MSALHRLAYAYLAAATAFCAAVVWRAHPVLGRDFASGMQVLARLTDQHVVSPALDAAREQDAQLIDSQDHPTTFRLTIRPLLPGEERTIITHLKPVAPPPHAVAGSDRLANPPMALTILPDLPEMAPLPAPKADVRLASAPPPAMTPRAVQAAARLKLSLTLEMQDNFELFLYVSKADSGPLAQRMYVFARTQDGDLKLLHDWAASTGREQPEISPRGVRTVTDTPRGYYELDPGRMYRNYHSYGWDQDMPNAMFFNWEKNGVQTGLAIHAATGADIARLGSRASAGCVHLSPRDAAELYNLIRASYRGPMPRLARDSSDSLSNKGVFAHDRAGHLKMTDGYKVLVFIEDYGGEKIVAQMF